MIVAIDAILVSTSFTSASTEVRIVTDVVIDGWTRGVTTIIITRIACVIFFLGVCCCNQHQRKQERQSFRYRLKSRHGCNTIGTPPAFLWVRVNPFPFFLMWTIVFVSWFRVVVTMLLNFCLYSDTIWFVRLWHFLWTQYSTISNKHCWDWVNTPW